MANDTISTDPSMLEEARRAAKEKQAPKAPYDAKALLKEVWDRLIVLSYEQQSFESFFKDAERNLACGEIVDTMTEAEFKEFAESMMWQANALNFQRESQRLMEKSLALRKAAIYKLCDRRQTDPNKDNDESLDLTTGTIRKGALTASASGSNPLNALRDLISKMAAHKP